MKHCGATEMLQPTNHTLQIYESWFVWYWPKQKAHHPRFSIFSWKWSTKNDNPHRNHESFHTALLKGYNVGCLFLQKNRKMFQFVSVSVCVILTFLQNASYHAHMTCLWPNFHSSGGDGGRLWLKFHHLWVWQGGRDNSCHVYGDIRGCDLRRFSLTPTKMFWCLNLTKTQAQCGHMIQLNLT